jgi:hypothetical protein
MNTQDIVETWRREAIQEGLQQGLERERKLLLRLLEPRSTVRRNAALRRRLPNRSRSGPSGCCRPRR